MEPSGFSSPRSECFPAGLRVLVVDDDPTWLKILEKMLKKCNYEVTTCNLARDALDLLRGRKDGYDIVISDVNMPDMDGFKLLEHVGLEMDLPVIMMSVDGETSRVMKGVQHGACDYLLKPIRMKELRNIWQHVLRKRIHEVRDTEGHENFDEIQLMRGGAELPDDGYLFSGDLFSGRKRKDIDNNKQHEDRMCGDPTSSVKKARVVWTVELHQKFVKAVNQIGFEKVGPKKILDLMGVPWLTRENVASHLQKYRLYLIRLQKENESKAVFGSATKDVSITVCHQNPVAQNTTAMPPPNILANETYPVSGNNILTHNDETTIKEGNPRAKGTLSVSNNMEPRKVGLKISFDYHSFGPLRSNVKSESSAPAQFPWANEVQAQPFQFKQEKKPHFQTEPKFDHITNIPIHHRTVNPVQHGPLHSSGPLRGDFDKLTQAYGKKKVNPVQHGLPHNPGPSNGIFEKPTQAYGRNKTHDPGELSKDENAPALFTVHPESHSRSFHAIDSIPCSSWGTRNHGLEKGLFGDLETIPKNSILGWDEKFSDYSKEFHPPDDLFGNLELFGYVNHGMMADFPPHLYDPLKFDSEYISDLVEYPVINQGLFIA